MNIPMFTNMTEGTAGLVISSKRIRGLIWGLEILASDIHSYLYKPYCIQQKENYEKNRWTKNIWKQEPQLLQPSLIMSIKVHKDISLSRNLTPRHKNAQTSPQ